MKQIQKTLAAIWQTREVRTKLGFTLAIFAVYRLLAHIPVPGVNLSQLQQLFGQSQFLSFLNVFSGGTLANFSIMAVGINPYITASIVMQLASFVFPTLKEMQKEGEAGRERVNQYTRLIAVPLAVVQSISVLLLLRSQNLLTAESPMVLATMIMTLVAGAMITLWLGEVITQYGIGNGISMILFAGILSQFPVSVVQVFSVATAEQFSTIAGFGVVFIVIIAAMVFMNEAIRKVTVQYARRVQGSRSYGGQTTHLPIRVNVAGVLPIIFAVSVMLAPAFVARLLLASGNASFVLWGQRLSIWFAQTSAIYMITYFIIVFVFTYFSALVFFNAEDISKELKKSGAFVPGIRPGSATRVFLEYVVTRITFIGALFLGIVALLPSLAQNLTGINSLAVGGTSILIVVSVVLETSKQVQSMLVGQKYEQFL